MERILNFSSIPCETAEIAEQIGVILARSTGPTYAKLTDLSDKYGDLSMYVAIQNL